MKIQIVNADGTSSEIGGVRWHPECVKAVGANPSARFPAALWTTTDKVIEHFRKVNERREKNDILPRDLKFVVDGIEYASAPFEIYDDCEDGQPWRHLGLLRREIPYGGSDSFWNEHA